MSHWRLRKSQESKLHQLSKIFIKTLKNTQILTEMLILKVPRGLEVENTVRNLITCPKLLEKEKSKGNYSLQSKSERKLSQMSLLSSTMNWTSFWASKLRTNLKVERTRKLNRKFSIHFKEKEWRERNLTILDQITDRLTILCFKR